LRRRRECQKDERGFALLLVLWSLVLLSLIIGQILSSGRRETQLASNLRQAAVAETVADSAVQDSIYHLLTSHPGPLPPSLVLTLPGGIALVHFRNIAGMVNPNMAPSPLLSAMLEECGASGVTVAHLTQALLDWRSPNNDPRALIAAYRSAGLGYAPLGQPFQSAEEIRLVLGMPPNLADCLVPHLSVYGDQEIPVPAFADPVVLDALLRMMRETGEALPMAPPDPNGSLGVQITAEGESTGARFIRQAIVRISSSDPAQPYRILTWREGE
jgi:general secretion pathway protein K